MNILILTSQLPWPATAGGRISQFSCIKALCRDHNFRIVLTNYQFISVDDACELERAIPSVSVLIPKRKNSLQTLSLRAKAYTSIKKYVPIATLAKRLFATKLDASQRNRDKESIFERPYFPFDPLSTEVIELILENLNWADVIQAEFHESLSVGFLPTGNVKKIFVCHQAHNLYVKSFYESFFYSQNESENNENKRLMAKMDYYTALEYERAALRMFDHVIVFSEQDRISLGSIDQASISVSPFPVPSDLTQSSPADDFVEPFRLVLLGPGDWHPNVDGLNWFVKNVLPFLLDDEAYNDQILHVVGRWSDSQVSSFDPDLIKFHGYVENLSDLLRGAITINPIFTGAGLRTKLLAGAAAGSPIVSTSFGAEGTGFEDRIHCLLADDPIQFARAISLILQDKSLALQLAKSAYRHVCENFSSERVRATRNRIYDELCRGS